MSTEEKQTRRRKGVSLRTQLHLLLILVAVFTLTASLLVSVTNTQEYLNDQMKSHAQDAATSLGLSISPYMDDPDLVIAETMVSAIFDSGYYAELYFTDTAGKVKISRTNPEALDAVPAWFIRYFPLTPPVASSEVNNGWNPAGNLSIRSNPGIAYQTLWTHAQESFYSILFITCLGLLLAQAILHAVLSPLHQIEKQARLVSRKQFVQMATKPFTKELYSVVKAMNEMVANIQRSFNELTHHADELQQKVYTDHLTGLGNRRMLEQRFVAEQAERDVHFFTMYFGLLHLPSLKQLHEAEGFKVADNYILDAVQLMKTAIAELPETQLFRLGGSDFSVISRATPEAILHTVEKLNEQMGQLNSDLYPAGFGSLVMMHVEPKQKLHECLTVLDSASIQKAQQGGIPAILDNTDTVSSLLKGRMAWLSVLKQVIKEHSFELWLQPVSDHKGQVNYVETFVRFYNNGMMMSTQEAYAMAEQHQLAAELDQAVVDFILNQLEDERYCAYAINLSRAAISNPEFISWLAVRLADKKRCPHLVFEVSEHSVLTAPVAFAEFVQVSKKANVKICIERFGSGMASFKYLTGLNIDYVKIDASYINSIDEQENQFFIKSICQISHGIGVKVLAPHVETEEMMNLCLRLNCDGVQGNWLLAPQKSLLKTSSDRLTQSIFTLELRHSPNFSPR